MGSEMCIRDRASVGPVPTIGACQVAHVYNYYHGTGPDTITGPQDRDLPFLDPEESDPQLEMLMTMPPAETGAASSSQGPGTAGIPDLNPWSLFPPPSGETGKGKGKIPNRIVRPRTGPGFDRSIWTTDDDMRRVWESVEQTLADFQRTHDKPLSLMTNFERTYCGLDRECRWPRPALDVNYFGLTDPRNFPVCGHGLHCNLHVTRRPGPNEGRSFLRCPLGLNRPPCGFYYWLKEDGTLAGPTP